MSSTDWLQALQALTAPTPESGPYTLPMHAEQFQPSGTWAPTTARVNPQVRGAQSTDPADPRATLMDPERVAQMVVEWANARPEDARRIAQRVPAYERPGDAGFGAFYPGNGAGITPHMEFGHDPKPLPVAHEWEHAYDMTEGRMPLGFDPAVISATYRELAQHPRPGYGYASDVANSTLLERPEDVVHFGHFLGHGVGYDWNAIPPDFRQQNFPWADTSRRGHTDDMTPLPAFVLPGATPSQQNTPTLNHRLVLPMVPR